MARNGGSAQDRRRSRRAAQRAELNEALARERSVTLEEAQEAVVAALEVRAPEASPERVALAAARQAFLLGDTCSCGHSYAEHEGAAGACSHTDGRGTCSCDGYVEAAASTAEAVEWSFERTDQGWALDLASASPTVTATNDPNALVSLLSTNTTAPATLRISLEGLTLTAGAVDLAELAPSEELPPRSASPDAPVVEQPTRSDRAYVKWTATLCPEGRLTDDGRCFAPGSMDWRELPLSLMAQIETQPGHDGAQVSGRIDQIWRQGDLLMGAGVFDAAEFGQDIARMVEDGILRGISVDVAVHEFEVGPKSDYFDADGTWAPRERGDEEPTDMLDLLFGEAEDTIFVVTSGTIGAATVCSFQAFADATISVAASLAAAASPAVWTYTSEAEFALVETTEEELAEFQALLDGGLSEHEARETVWPTVEPLTAAAAGLAPLKPPADWFADPAFDGPTALTVSDDGRICGHAALWDTCHIGIPGVCTTAPASETDYAYFLLKEVECDGGERVACGTVTLEAPHADRRLGRADATAHYDNTGTAAADVTVGEDEHGIWVAGALRPDVTAEQARDLRGSVLSGDWRNVDGHLELVALLAVNVPGFPVPRARALVAAGEDGSTETLTLVAAGINVSSLVTDEERARFEALRDRADGKFAKLADRVAATEAAA